MYKQSRNKMRTCYADVYNTAISAFGYDKDTALKWYLTKQEKYGDKSPYEMCKEGKSAMILKDLVKLSI